MKDCEEAFYVFFNIDSEKVPSVEVQNFWKEFLYEKLYPVCMYSSVSGNVISVSLDCETFVNLLKEYTVSHEDNSLVDYNELGEFNLPLYYEVDIEEYRYFRFVADSKYDVYELYQG